MAETKGFLTEGRVKDEVRGTVKGAHYTEKKKSVFQTIVAVPP